MHTKQDSHRNLNTSLIWEPARRIRFEKTSPRTFCPPARLRSSNSLRRWHVIISRMMRKYPIIGRRIIERQISRLPSNWCAAGSGRGMGQIRDPCRSPSCCPFPSLGFCTRAGHGSVDQLAATRQGWTGLPLSRGQSESFSRPVNLL